MDEEHPGYAIPTPPTPDVIGEEPAPISTTTIQSSQGLNPSTTAGYESLILTSTSTPLAGGSTQGYPAEASTQGSPAEGNTQGAPVEGNTQGAPAGSNTQETPAQGNTQGSVSDVNNQGSPAEEITQGSPAASTQPEGYPAGESTQGAPAEENTHEAPTEANTSASPAVPSNQGFAFLQIQGNASYKLGERHFLDAGFDNICPSKNCLDDCKNLTQVFLASSGMLNYNTATDAKDVPVSLFGICSNLANVTALVEDSDNATLKSYFTNPSTGLGADDDIGLITSNLTMCLVDTCDTTRNPSECRQVCRPEHLLQSQDTLSISPGIYQCAHQLCQSTCGLPYADQDVFGIGVRFKLLLLLL